MKFVFLTSQFYIDYAKCTEIERKLTRPYIQVYTKINEVQFAIPFRSGISHREHVLWTDRENHSGLDFSKAVVITDEKYINTELIPHIRQNEFDSLRGKEYLIKQKMLKHIREYKKAKLDLNNKRNKLLYEFSTMQYFEEYIADIENADDVKIEIKLMDNVKEVANV